MKAVILVLLGIFVAVNAQFSTNYYNTQALQQAAYLNNLNSVLQYSQNSVPVGLGLGLFGLGGGLGLANSVNYYNAVQQQQAAYLNNQQQTTQYSQFASPLGLGLGLGFKQEESN